TDATVFASDLHHCGRCGHDCLGGECLKGSCQPYELGHVTPGAARYVHVDGESAYVVDDQSGALVAFALDGGGARYLTTGELDLGDFAIGDDAIFFTARSVKRVSKHAPGGPKGIVLDAKPYEGVAVEGAVLAYSVYTEHEDGGVFLSDKDGNPLPSAV